ncbi:MAG TPA: hypothetical protein VFR81_19620 [Longimicrobium sp.]|nr:hypothetical protein [Longimicrobium sp.]
MKTLLHRWVLALLLVAAPAAAQPGEGHRDGRPPTGMEMEERRPFELLHRARAELQLTDGQVSRLQRISRELQARNRPLRERLEAELMRIRQERRAEIERELRPLSPEERRARLRELMEQPPRRELPSHMRPVAEEMRRNIRHATREAQQVLTPRQRMRARRMFEEHRDRMRERRPGAPRGRRPHGRAP